MENTIPEPNLVRVHKAIEAAWMKVRNAQRDNYDPGKSKEDTQRNLIEASGLLYKAKEDLATQSVDITVSQAVDYVVYKIDALPKENVQHRGRPNVHAPDWPQIREGFTKEVKRRLADFFFQLEGEMFVTIDPKLFQSQARTEASEVVFGLAL